MWVWRDNSVVKVFAIQGRGPEPGSPAPPNIGWAWWLASKSCAEMGWGAYGNKLAGKTS